ncbi:MAG TPA: helix-turn-helix domain-containing protein [Acidimicrobiales bacterium]|nr:helix-turn-helix domain-containing protein [Acidimicrobiales bacterium]
MLEAAEVVFASQGVGAPVDEIARQAGVGVGTVYRHFPTKEALYQAIVVDRMTQLVREADGLATAEDPGAALFAVLSRIVEVATQKRDLADALSRAGIDVKTASSDAFGEMRRAVDVLLRRAQAAGVVRADVNLPDLVGLVAGTCLAADHPGSDAGMTSRMLGIVWDGLRTSHAG